MYKINLKLVSLESQLCRINYPKGYIFRGVLMDWFRQIQPSVAHDYHEPEKIRDYSIQFTLDFENNFIEVVFYFFREKIYQLILECCVRKKELSLGSNPYRISQIEHGPIDLKIIFENAQPIRSFSFSFKSPTYYNTNLGDFPVRIPIVEIIYNQLCSLWNTYNENKGNYDKKKFSIWCSHHIYLSGHKIKTVEMDIGKRQKVAGFIGSVSFQIKKPNRFFYKKSGIPNVRENYLISCKWVDFLNKFSEYTNMGANRTAALGQAQYIPKRYYQE